MKESSQRSLTSRSELLDRVVLEPVERFSLWKANPNLLVSEVVATAQENVFTHHLNEDGCLIVAVLSLSSVQQTDSFASPPLLV